MKHLILALLTALLPCLGICRGTSIAFHLVDDQTGKPLIVLPNGNPEAFLAGSMDKSFSFYGYFTHTKIETELPLKGEKLQPRDIGARFKLFGENQWARVEDWPGNKYNWINVQRHNEWKDYAHYLEKKFNTFGLSREEMGGAFDPDCTPFTFPRTYLFDPDVKKIRWAKFYATARKGYDPSHRMCKNQAWHIYAYGSVGSSVDTESLLIDMEDARDSEWTLRVSLKNGQILGPLPSKDIKVIDVQDAINFKDAFMRRNHCPTLSAEGKRRYRFDHERFIKTKIGHCYAKRIDDYGNAVLHHFFGEPAEQPEQ
jgi:hypothetical protein